MSETIHHVTPPNPLYGLAFDDVLHSLKGREAEALDLAKKPLTKAEQKQLKQAGAILMTPAMIANAYSYAADVLEILKDDLQKCRTEEAQHYTMAWSYRSLFHSMVLDGIPMASFDLVDRLFDEWQEAYTKRLRAEPKEKQSFRKKLQGKQGTIFDSLTGFRYTCQASYSVLHEMVLAHQMAQGIPLKDCASSPYELTEWTYRSEEGLGLNDALTADDLMTIAERTADLVDELLAPYGKAFGEAQPEMAFLVAEALAPVALASAKTERPAHTYARRFVDHVRPSAANDGEIPLTRPGRATAFSRQLEFQPEQVPANDHRPAPLLLRDIIYNPHYVPLAVERLQKATRANPGIAQEMGAYLNAVRMLSAQREQGVAEAGL